METSPRPDLSGTSVPLIDLRPFLHGTEHDKARVAERVDAACREIGFLVVEGHGVSEASIREMHRVSAEYFARPYWEKMRHKMPADRYRGYTPLGSESLAYSLDEETPPDLKESFSIGPFDHAWDEYHFGTAGARFFAPNIWPDRPRDMRTIWEAWFTEMERVAADLMRLFARSLGMPEDFFRDKIDHHISNFSVIHYPAQEKPPEPGQLRGGAHTDYGSLTIVHTDTDVGGLEVRKPDGSWEKVPCIPGAFTINLGDLMAEWTNDHWVSTMHRVANPPTPEAQRSKTSLLFFHQPNYDAHIECIPTCTGPGNPPRYTPTTSGEHVTSKVTKHRTPGLRGEEGSEVKATAAR